MPQLPPAPTLLNIPCPPPPPRIAQVLDVGTPGLVVKAVPAKSPFAMPPPPMTTSRWMAGDEQPQEPTTTTTAEPSEPAVEPEPPVP